MKRIGITYSDGVKHMSAERVLGKRELREIFPEAACITQSIQVQRKRMHKSHSGKEGHAWLRRQKIVVRNRAVLL
jgi:hypothetical protein